MNSIQSSMCLLVVLCAGLAAADIIDFAIVEIHLNLNDSEKLTHVGSYLNVKLEPLSGGNLTIKLNGTSYDSVKVAKSATKLDGIYKYEFPTEIPAENPMQITAMLTTRSGSRTCNYTVDWGNDHSHDNKSAPADVLYHPLNRMTKYTSLRRLSDDGACGGNFSNVWDSKDDQHWNIDNKNPEQINVTSLNRTSVGLKCFICKHIKADKVYGNYTLYLYTANETVTILPLMNKSVDVDSGLFTVTVPAGVTLDPSKTRVKLVFNYFDESMISFNHIFNPTDTIPTEFLKKQRRFVREDIYLNEVHIPTNRDQTKESDKFWIEFIQDQSVKLDNYYILFIQTGQSSEPQPIFELQIDDGDRRSSLQRFSGEQAAHGYLIWKNTTADANAVINEMAVVQNMTTAQKEKVNLIVLLQRQSDKWYIQDYIRFDWKSPSDCNTNALAPFDSPCGKSIPDCQKLSSNLAHYSAASSFSRCGLEKAVDDDLKMWYWRVENSTQKNWNTCPKPCARFKTINFPDSTITVASLQDSMPQLTTSGLEVAFWQLRIAEPVYSIHTVEWDANLRFAKNSSAKQINVKIGQKVVNGDSEVQVRGKLTSVTSNSIYVITLLHHYSFMNFTLDDARNRLVDIFLFGYPVDKEAAISLMARFTHATELTDLLQNDIGYFKVESLTIDSIFENNELPAKTCNTAAWKVKKKNTNELKTPDTVYFLNILRSYARIYRISSAGQFTLSLAQIPRSIINQPLLKKGILITNVQIYVVTNSSVRDPLVVLNDSKYITFNSTNTDYILRTNLPIGNSSSNWFQHKKTTVFLWQGTTDQAKSLALPIQTEPQDPEMNLIDSLILEPTDLNQTDHLRCLSDKPNNSYAFQSVGAGQPCSPPMNIVIYKVCSYRVGLMLTNERETPTDKLYLYQLSDKKKVLVVQPVRTLNHSLSGTYSILPMRLEHSLPYTAVILTFTHHPPTEGADPPVGAIDMAVWYNNNITDKQAEAYKHSILDIITPHGHLTSDRNPIMLKTGPVLDKRRCILSCVYSDQYQIIYSAGRSQSSTGAHDKIDYTDLQNGTDKFCVQIQAGNPADQYNQVRINEINVDSMGFRDREEFIELIAPKDFNMLFGFQILIIAEKGNDEYSIVKLLDIDPDNKFVDMGNNFEKSMLVISHKEGTEGNQKFPHLKFIHPNEMGAILLVWGGNNFLRGKTETTIDQNLMSIFRMENFIIDMIFYKQSDQVSQKSLGFEQFVGRLLPNSSRTTPIIEPPDSKNESYSISRCFCSEPNNFSCFELSTTTSLGENNTCPNLYKKTIKFCKTASSLTEPYVINQIQQDVNSYYALSTYQIQDLTICPSKSHSDSKLTKFIVSVTIGFPEEGLLRLLDNLNFINSTFSACENDDVCIQQVTANAPPHNTGMIVGIVMGMLCILVIIVIAVVCVLKRVKRKRDMSARFDACNDDDDEDSFIPTGQISFSNPWYNQNHSNGNSYSQLKT